MTMAGSDNTLARIRLSGWRQFDNVEIAFHERLTILTGPNATGKTTVMNLLSRVIGWDVPIAASPGLLSRVSTFVSGVWRVFAPRASHHVPSSYNQIAEVECDPHMHIGIFLPETEEATFYADIDPQIRLPGVYIPSHRPLYTPVQTSAVRRRGMSLEEMFNEYQARTRFALTGEKPTRDSSPLAWLKAAIPLMSDFDRSAFENLLRAILPESLGFSGLRCLPGMVNIETDTGNFSIEAVSGGIAALIDMTFQLFTYSSAHPRFVTLIDEPENHLHPELQRLVLPKLIESFPHVQFIVTTHSPLVVTSVKTSYVYALWREEASFGDATDPGTATRVTSRLLDVFERSGTANETLMKVLGLDYTMPLWAAEELEQALNAFKEQGMSAEALDRMESRLERSGLGRYVPHALGRASKIMPRPFSV